jgi:hypothetical protein
MGNVLGQVICWRPISSFFICSMNLLISLYYTFHINILLTYTMTISFLNEQARIKILWVSWMTGKSCHKTYHWLVGTLVCISIFWSVLGWFGLWLVWTFVCTRECRFWSAPKSMDIGPHQWEQFVVHTRERGQIVAHTEIIVVNIIVSTFQCSWWSSLLHKTMEVGWAAESE